MPQSRDDTSAQKRRRRGRPRLGRKNRRTIAFRLDPDLMAALQREAKKRGRGYQTHMHDILSAHVKRVDRMHAPAFTPSRWRHLYDDESTP